VRPRAQSDRLRRLALLVALVFATIAAPASAHKPSDSYLTLRVVDEQVFGQWDVALRDLDYAIGLDDDGDGAITWGEVRGHSAAVSAYAFAHLTLRRAGGVCVSALDRLMIDQHGDGAYAVLRFTAPACAGGASEEDAAAELDVEYRLFFDLDPLHRGLVQVSFERATELRTATGYDAERGTLASLLAQPAGVTIVGPEHPEAHFARRAPGRAATVAAFVQNGVWHIWTGFDHLLFLASLLLPAVARRERGVWRSAVGFRAALTHTVKVVTAFTVAHSLTLSIAALGIVHVSSRLVETLIAVSVAIAALNNLVPLFPPRRTWQVALAFGLVHGFGFASVLGDLALPRAGLLWALVSFNVGVELGQLAVVIALLPVVFAVRETPVFRWGVMTAGSAAIVLLALAWAGERAFNLRLF